MPESAIMSRKDQGIREKARRMMRRRTLADFLVILFMRRLALRPTSYPERYLMAILKIVVRYNT